MRQKILDWPAWIPIFNLNQTKESTQTIVSEYIENVLTIFGFRSKKSLTNIFHTV